MKNPLYWLKLHFSGRSFATIRQLKKTLQVLCRVKLLGGGIPKISGPQAKGRELVTLGMQPPHGFT